MTAEAERFPDIAELLGRARSGQTIWYLVGSFDEVRDLLAAIEAAIEQAGTSAGELIRRGTSSAGYEHPSGGSIRFVTTRNRKVLAGYAGDVLVVDALYLNTEHLLDISIIRRRGVEVFER